MSKEKRTPAQVAVGKRARDFRVGLGLSQEDLASRTGGVLDRVAFSKLENGDYMAQTDKARIALCEAFGLVSLDDLHDLLHGGLTIDAALRRSRAPRVQAAS